MTPLRGISVGYARRPELGIRRKRRNPLHWPVCLASCPLHTAISDLGSFDRWALCRDAGKPDNRGLGGMLCRADVFGMLLMQGLYDNG